MGSGFKRGRKSPANLGASVEEAEQRRRQKLNNATQLSNFDSHASMLRPPA